MGQPTPALHRVRAPVPQAACPLKATLAGEDPTNEIGAAWGVKERLRQLLAETDEQQIRHRLYEFYRDAARADMPETTRLATTIETWWPAIHSR